MTTEASPATRLHRFGPAAAIVVGTSAASAAVFGVMTTLIVVGVPLCAVAAWYAVRRPGVAVSVMVVIEVTNLAGVVAEYAPIPVFHASLALGVVAVVVALRSPALRGRLSKGTAVCVAPVFGYFCTEVIAALGSQDVEASTEVLESSLADCLFLVVVLLLAQMSGRWWAIAAAVVVPFAVISVLTVISQVGFGGAESFGGFATATAASGELVTTLRFGGPLPDSNFWGRHLVLGVPLAAALIVRAARIGNRWAVAGWSASVLAMLVGVYLTQSRGTIIAVGLAFLVWVLASGPTVRRRSLIGLPFLALIVLIPGIGNRLVALVADVSQSGAAPVDPSVLGRIAAQEVAWEMFRDRPVFGFGPGLYPLALPRYAGTVDTAVLGPTDAAHNLYAQLAAESGLVGVVGWVFLVGGFAALIAIRVARMSAGMFVPERALAAATLAGIIGWSFASVFLHLAYFRTFAIILALAGAIGSATGPSIASDVQTGRSRIWETVLATVLGIAAAGVVFAVTPTHDSTTASQRVTLLPGPELEGYYGYALDIRTRPVLLPTYAALMTAGDRSATAVADPVRGVVKFSVTAADPQTARADLESAVAMARRNLAEFRADSWYELSAVGGVQERSERTRSAAAMLAAAVAGLLTAVAVLLLRRASRLPRHRRAFRKYAVR